MDGAFKLKLLYDYQTMDRELSKLVGIIGKIWVSRLPFQPGILS